MIDLLKDPTLLLLAIPSILIALNTVFKNLGMDSRFCPIVNLVGGFMGLPLFLSFGISWYAAVIGSLMLGLSASGVYDFAQKTVRNQ